ncbi:MAG: NADH-quinone oxidoreductase subunit NuoE [Trueperaceae bacterium]
MIELDTVKTFFGDKPDRLQEILDRYPAYGRRSALMPLLWEVQRAERHVSEARVVEIAEILGIHATEVKGVMSFYSTYHGEPVGRWHLQVCSTLSCALAGSDQLCDHLVRELDIVPGETDADGTFSLQKVECLGSCTTAPVLQVNDAYYERVSRSRLDALLDALRRNEPPEPWRERYGDVEGPSGGEGAGPPRTPSPNDGDEADGGAAPGAKGETS